MLQRTQSIFGKEYVHLCLYILLFVSLYKYKKKLKERKVYGAKGTFLTVARATGAEMTRKKT